MVGEVKGVGRSRGRGVVVEFVKNKKKEESQKKAAAAGRNTTKKRYAENDECKEIFVGK
jgi:hypothetical protein